MKDWHVRYMAHLSFSSVNRQIMLLKLILINGKTHDFLLKKLIAQMEGTKMLEISCK